MFWFSMGSYRSALDRSIYHYSRHQHNLHLLYSLTSSINLSSFIKFTVLITFSSAEIFSCRTWRIRIINLFDLILKIFDRIVATDWADFCWSFEIPAFAKQLASVEVFTFCHARSSIFIASKIKKTGRSFPLLIVTTSLCYAKDL